MEQRRFGSLVAGIDVLETLAATPDGASVTDLASTLALDKGYLHRLLRMLQQRGYVEQDPASKTFRATVKLVSLASAILRNLDVLSAAPPVMRNLLESNGETVHLARRVANGGVYVAQERPRTRVSVETDIGSQPELHCTATGKALLAFSSAEELRSLLEEPFVRHTPRTLTTFSELEKELAGARLRGYAVDDGESSEELRCVAAPIFDMTGKVVACLGMSGPMSRVSPDRLSPLGEAAAAAAVEISATIGGRPPAPSERGHTAGQVALARRGEEVKPCLSTAELQTTARMMRREIVETVARAKGGHLGGPLSAADILTALYFRTLNIRPDEPDWPDRDRFILSKGHSSVALYAALALRGYFPVDELATFDAIGSRLQGHPDMKALPGLDMSSGSLGLGFSAGVGIALGAKLLQRDFTTYVMVGDGECNEGIVWEGAHVAERYALDNLIVIVDKNELQQFGWRGDASGRRRPPYTGDELRARWQAFGWAVSDVDGHDVAAIMLELERAKEVQHRPAAVIAHTIKGKGVSFMEDSFRWHTRVPTGEELETALDELSDPIGQARSA